MVNLYLSCPDFEYVNEHNVPRYGAGIFGVLLEHLYKMSTGKELRFTLYGKPLHSTYQCVGGGRRVCRGCVGVPRLRGCPPWERCAYGGQPVRTTALRSTGTRTA